MHGFILRFLPCYAFEAVSPALSRADQSRAVVVGGMGFDCFLRYGFGL